MRKLAVFLAAFCGVAIAALAQTPGTVLAGRAEILDGDTVVIDGVRIRLDGYDAPESGGQCQGGVHAGELATNALIAWIGDREVRCVVSGHDNRHDRAVARCSVGGVDMGVWMVEHGWARDWPRYSCGRYAASEAAARHAGAGVWGMQCPSLWGSRNYTRSCPSH